MLNLKKQASCLLISSLTFSMVAQAESSIAHVVAAESASSSQSKMFIEANKAVPSPVLIFISFSMPAASLRQWAAQAQKIHAPLIIQGLLNSSFAKTEQAVADLAPDNRGGVVLETRLFREYRIKQVPAVVVRRLNVQPCPANQSCWQEKNYDVVSGDVGLESALQQIADHGVTADIAQSLLAQWRQS